MECNFQSFENWQLQKELGSGAYGEVFLWVNRKTKEEIATKSLKRNNTLGPDEEKKIEERWLQEFEYLKNLNTDCIVRHVKLKDENFLKYLNDHHAWHTLPVMIMEYCNGGDLRAHLQKIDNINGLREYEIRQILSSLSSAVEYMHSRCNIKHRDLKPDNIVIHKLPNGERIYKLTDFGFASYIKHKTMLQSVVGTRNYFAPEVVDTSEYTKTVDYWSMGIIAFEMICGTLPFIPHQTIYNIIKSIKAKSNHCIAITENYGNLPIEFKFHEHIFDENRVSKIFRDKIESWLQLSLDKNFRTRGGKDNFFKILNELLNTCILTTFNLSSLEFHEFELNLNSNKKEFIEELCNVTKIPKESIYLILPVGHPLQSVLKLKHPMDLYVEEWQKKNEIMLYVIDVDIKRKNVIPDLKISETVKHWLSCSKNDQIPLWLLRKFAFDTHFLLANGQHHLSTMLRGIKEYAMDVENEMLDFKCQIDEIEITINVLSGHIEHFEMMRSKAIHQLKRIPMESKFYEEFCCTWQQNIENYKKKIQDTKSKVLSNLITRNSSALRRMREESNSQFYNDIIKKDLFELEKFRKHLAREHQCIKIEDLMKKSNICSVCCDAVYKFIDNRGTIFEEGQQRKKMRDILGIHHEYIKIKDISKNVKKILMDFHENIQNQTNKFQETFVDILLSHGQKSMKIVTDGEHQENSNDSINQSSMSTSNNSFCHSINDVMSIPTNNLIREAQETMELIAHEFNMNGIIESINFN